MERRKFLKLSTGSVLAGAALTSLPKFVWAKQESETKLTKYSNEWNIALQPAMCILDIDQNMFASEKSYLLYVDKVMLLSLTEKDDPTTYSIRGLKITKIEKISNDLGASYDIYAALNTPKPSETSSTFAIFDDIAKLRYIPQVSITLFDSKGGIITVLQEMKAKKEDSNEYDEFEDCFVTTACVKQMNMQDDCIELQTLRSLRDTFMKGTVYGDERIAAYNYYGPKIVEKLNQLQNTEEVYHYIFKQTVLPTFNLAQNGKKEEAINLYVDFMIGLWTKLEENGLHK